MNRINQMIDSNASAAAVSMLMMKMSVTPKNVNRYARQLEGFKHDLDMWIRISQAVRGWQL